MDEKKKTNELTDIEIWMENFFLDPFTSYIDQITFRVDLYDMEDSIMIEVLLEEFIKSDTEIHVHDNEMTITAIRKDIEIEKKESRTIEFPFPIITKRIKAVWNHHILEIWISKDESGNRKNRKIIIR